MSHQEKPLQTLKQFERMWVALNGDHVVASGRSVIEVKQKAEKRGLHEYSFYLVPSSSASLAPLHAVGLNYPYTPRVGPVEVEYGPLVDVVFTNPKNGQRVEVRSLIDSGAAGIILHGQFAELLSIDLESGKLHEFQGIAHTPVRAYDHVLDHARVSALGAARPAGLFGRDDKVTFERFTIG